MRFLQIFRSRAWNAHFFVAILVWTTALSASARADDTVPVTPSAAPAPATSPAIPPVSNSPAATVSVPPAIPAHAKNPLQPSPSSATVHCALRFTRTDMASAADTAKATPIVIGTPALTTLDGNSATIAVSGGDLTYSVAVSPTIEKNNSMLILWTLRVGGKSLPGATSALLTGATRVPVGQDALIAEIALTDPATGHRSDFQLAGITTVGDAAIGVQ